MGGWVLLFRKCIVSFRGTGDRSRLAVDHVPGPGADSRPALSLVEEERGGRWNF